jgi:hypothetical protein
MSNCAQYSGPNPILAKKFIPLCSGRLAEPTLLLKLECRRRAARHSSFKSGFVEVRATRPVIAAFHVDSSYKWIFID